MKTRNLTIGLVVAVLAGCAGIPVHTDYDRQTRFDQLATFAWLEPSHERVEDPVLDSAILGGKVRRAVTMVLTERGFESVPAEEADFLVTYHTTSRERIRDHGVSVGIGFGGFYRRGHHTIIVRDGFGMQSFQEGSLIVDVIDARTNELVWRGWTRDIVAPGRYTEDRVTGAIQAILDRFPPAR